ncbi:MAG: SDR family oxidoreductase [Acidobacteria bacterium]|jgi:3-oxoacyl-[acyl-carrier protein] reductase/pyridoxal 4-dehydrogenase|nr:SDR family oxidoreductase [Acidobacteriota bacterium]
MNHQDRVAIITGSAQGIGTAIARNMSAEGAAVVIADLNGEGASEVAESLPNALPVTVDTSSEDQVGALVDATIERFGKVDVLVNNAAIVPFTEWDDVDFAEWRRIMSVNLDGVFLTSRAVYPHMRDAGYGRIVNIASNAFVAGTPNLAHYVASKGGVVGFTRALATELGRYGITVNAVAPGLTETEGTVASPHAQAFDFVQSLQAIPRRAMAVDIAPAVSFLASEEAAWVTGSLLVVDGGHTRH